MAERPDPALLPRSWRARADIDLSPGVPDLSGFPRAAWLRAERSVLERASGADLGYGDPLARRRAGADTRIAVEDPVLAVPATSCPTGATPDQLREAARRIARVMREGSPLVSRP